MAKIAQELALEFEEDPQHPGDDEDDLTVGTSRRSVSRNHSPHSSSRLAWQEEQKPLALRENVNKRSGWQPGHRIRAAFHAIAHCHHFLGHEYVALTTFR
jgi:hypothetical protein